MAKFVELETITVNVDAIAFITDYEQDGVPYEGQPDWKSVIQFQGDRESIYLTLARDEVVLRLSA